MTPPPTDLPGLLRIEEVAELLGVSVRTIRRLAADGVLVRVRLGHRTARYTRRSVLALVDPERGDAPGEGPEATQEAGAHDAQTTG